MEIGNENLQDCPIEGKQIFKSENKEESNSRVNGNSEIAENQVLEHAGDTLHGNGKIFKSIFIK